MSTHTLPTTAGDLLRLALAERGLTPTEFSGAFGAGLDIPLDPDDPARGTLEISDRDFSLNHAKSSHTGWSIFRRAQDGTVDAEPLYISGDGETAVDCATDSTAAAAFVVEYRAATDDFERARAVLRATIKPRIEARDYAASVNGGAAATMPWGMAMSSAQKSLRNGAHISPGANGSFTLTGPDGGRRAHFQPA